MWLSFSENEFVTVTLTPTGGLQVRKEVEPIQHHFMVFRSTGGLSTQTVNDASIQTPSSPSPSTVVSMIAEDGIFVFAAGGK